MTAPAAPEAGEEIARLRAMLAARPPVTGGVEARRAGFEAMMARMPRPDDLRVTQVPDGPLKGAWIDTDAARPSHGVLYVHGGGFAIGSAESYAELAGRIGRAARARVLVLDHPLAPEAPFPAAPHACFEAWVALADGGADAARWSLAGDSSGANLALGLLLAIRDAGLPAPAGAALISAYLDMTHSRPSVAERTPRDPFVDLATIDGPRLDYAPGIDPRDPRISPIFANLAGLPPVLALVGEDEAFHDDSVDLAAAIRAAGGQAEAEVWPGMVHVWPLFGPMLAEGCRASDRIGAWLSARMVP